MKRSGLQKNIAFIFDGKPAQNSTNPVSEDSSGPEARNISAGNTDNSGTTASAEAAPQTQPVSTNSVQGHSASSQSSRYLVRPEPVAQKNLQPGNTDSFKTWMGSLKKTAQKPSDKTANPNQTKMFVLIGVLSLILVAVIVFVFNSGPASANAQTVEKTDGASAAAPENINRIDQWIPPQEYPIQQRDPMKPAVKPVPGSAQNNQAPVVKGIVYSPTRPSAIISSEVVFVGQTIAGCKIIKIDKESVEFEKDGKRWKQQVEQ